MRPVLLVLAAAVAIAGCGSDQPRSAAPSESAQRAALKGAPAPLRKLHDQANLLLDGGADAFMARLAELKGYPVVVNKWASWCPPCRAEFPFFQRLSLRYGKKVAFIGVDGNDSDADARKFLRSFPVSYPHYKDPKLGISEVFNAVQAFPATAFYDSKGGLAFVHQGGYPTRAKLAADIERYAR